MAYIQIYCDRKINRWQSDREREREREREGQREIGGNAGVRRARAGFRKVEHSFGDNERICNHDYIVQDPAVS